MGFEFWTSTRLVAAISTAKILRFSFEQSLCQISWREQERSPFRAESGTTVAGILSRTDDTKTTGADRQSTSTVAGPFLATPPQEGR